MRVCQAETLVHYQHFIIVYKPDAAISPNQRYSL